MGWRSTFAAGALRLENPGSATYKSHISRKVIKRSTILTTSLPNGRIISFHTDKLLSENLHKHASHWLKTRTINLDLLMIDLFLMIFFLQSTVIKLETD